MLPNTGEQVLKMLPFIGGIIIIIVIIIFFFLRKKEDKDK